MISIITLKFPVLTKCKSLPYDWSKYFARGEGEVEEITQLHENGEFVVRLTSGCIRIPHDNIAGRVIE